MTTCILCTRSFDVVNSLGEMVIINALLAIAGVPSWSLAWFVYHTRNTLFLTFLVVSLKLYETGTPSAGPSSLLYYPVASKRSWYWPSIISHGTSRTHCVVGNSIFALTTGVSSPYGPCVRLTPLSNAPRRAFTCQCIILLVQNNGSETTTLDTTTCLEEPWYLYSEIGRIRHNGVFVLCMMPVQH